MNGLNHFRSLLQDLGRALGIDSLAPDEQGYCSLMFDHRLNLTMRSNGDRVSFIINLGPIERDQDQNLINQMLADNLQNGLDGRGVLALDENGHAVLVQQDAMNAFRGFGQLEVRILDLVDRAAAWQARINEHVPALVDTVAQDQALAVWMRA